MKKVSVDYGDRKQEIDVPEDSIIAQYEDPIFLSDPEAAVRASIRSPQGLPPLRELAKPGMKVAIGFDDITRPALPAQTIIPIIIEELNDAGIPDRDIRLISATSNHRKNTRTELANHLGPSIFNRFWKFGNILNHDCSDPAQLSGYGVTKFGRIVEHNKVFLEADLQIYQGNVSAQPWGGFTGTGVAIGLASTRSIAAHHSFYNVPDPNKRAKKFVGESIPGVKDDITEHLEQITGKSTFYVNAVSGMGGKLAGVFAGHAKSISPPAWEMAKKNCTIKVPQADVLIVGLPSGYSYGSADNTLIAAVGALVPLRLCPDKPVLREGGVVIAVSPTRGQIDPKKHPSYAEAIALYGKHHSLRELVDYEDEFNGRPDFQLAYSTAFGYPPLHAFWILYELEYGLQRAGAVIMAGTSNPGAFRQLGLTCASNFDAAWKLAKKYVGENPVTVVAPTFWSRPRIKFLVEAA